MFHATLLMISTCFIHIICHIYAFSGTNLLTRCRSASSCFLLFLVSEILVTKYSRNRTKSTPRFLFFPEPSRTPESRQREAMGAPHHTLARPEGGRAALWCGGPRPPPRLPFRLHKAPASKTLTEEATVRETFQSRRHREAKIWGTGVSVPAPCRSGEVPPEGFSIDTAAISTAIFITAAAPMKRE